MKSLELLAPAKDMATAICAINHGADAVYMGCEQFGARQNANNAIKDIEQVVNYAHRYHARVHITMNTILFDDELQKAYHLANQMYNIGVDALIVQDMALLNMNLPPIAIHASTQMNNIDIEKIKFYKQLAINRVILARELSLTHIQQIANEVDIDLECFVHGSLCVCYSGQCYLSYFLGNRSANRGACAQPCRLPYNLYDADGNLLAENKHLLSLKDMCRIDNLQDLINAGVSSFKIEGRLKDQTYVANVVGAYRMQLDNILENNHQYKKSSLGKVYFDFVPDVEKTFNRGYTSYFLHNTREKIAQINTPKSMGKYVGEVKKVSGNIFLVETEKQLSNGDGLCWFDEKGVLQGTNINGIEKQNWIKTSKDKCPAIGTKIYMNYDKQFFELLKREQTQRKISTNICFFSENEIFKIRLTDEDGNISIVEIGEGFQVAQNPEKCRQNIENQLKKSGGTIFEVLQVNITSSQIPFIPLALLNEKRRQLLTQHENLLIGTHKKEIRNAPAKNIEIYSTTADYTWNISNRQAEEFYRKQGVNILERAWECQSRQQQKTVMKTKYCLRFQLDMCLKNNPTRQKKLYMAYNDNYFCLDFNCRNCEMLIKPIDKIDK